LKVEDLAKNIGISSGALSKYQNDAAEPGAKALVKIAQYFNVSVDWLLGLSHFRQTENGDFTAKDLGLPEEFIENYKPGTWASEDRVMVNLMFSNNYFWTSLEYVSRLWQARKRYQLKMPENFGDLLLKVQSESNDTLVICEQKDYANSLMFNAQEMFNQAVRECFDKAQGYDYPELL